MKLSRFLVVILLLISSNAYSVTDERFQQLVFNYRQILSKESGREKFELALRFLLPSPSSPSRLHYLYIDRDFITENRKRIQQGSDLAQNVPEQELFEKDEPGYSKGMINAYGFLATQIGLEINTELIIRLHDIAVDGVSCRGQPLMKGVSEGIGSYSFQDQWKSYSRLADRLAREELDRSKLLFDRQYILDTLASAFPLVPSVMVEKFIQKSSHLYSSLYSNKNILILPSLETFPKRIQPFLDHYRNQIRTVSTLDGKLMAVAELLRALQVVHPFEDGNQRTFSFLLLTRLLIENDLPPAILEDPYLFNGYLSVERMAEKVRQGIKIFFDVTKSDHDSIFPAAENQVLDDRRFFMSSDYQTYFSTQETLQGRFKRYLSDLKQ